MRGIEVCRACGVPLMVSRELKWEPNGVVSLTSSPRNRMISFESETLDKIFRGMEELIGVPIGHIVIESRRRETRRYIERLLPPEIRDIMEGRGGREEGTGPELDEEERRSLFAAMRAINLSVMDIARVYGYGDPRLGERWESGADYPWRVSVVRNPYSLLFIAADNLGTTEAVEGADMRVRYERIGEDTYRIETYPGEHPVELKERLRRRRYDFKPGNIAYERCPECDLPKAVARRKWDLEAGIIRDQDTGRRLAFFGPVSVDSIFDDLQEELGEEVPGTVIEAMRRHIKVAWGTDGWNRDRLSLQQLTAVSGLGNVAHFESDGKHLEVVYENACFHLPLVGATQALVELAYHAESSTYEWHLADDGDLSVTVNVKR